MAITATKITASKITASPITASAINTGSCPLTFENGILNGGRVLCSEQLLLGENSAYIDGALWVGGAPWVD